MPEHARRHSAGSIIVGLEDDKWSSCWVCQSHHFRVTRQVPLIALWRLQGAKRGKVPRQRWHSWHSWQCGLCNLQNLKDARETESLSLRQYGTLNYYNNLREMWRLRRERSPLGRDSSWIFHRPSLGRDSFDARRRDLPFRKSRPLGHSLAEAIDASISGSFAIATGLSLSSSHGTQSRPITYGHWRV